MNVLKILEQLCYRTLGKDTSDQIIFGKDLFELIYFKTFQNTYQSTADDTTKFPVIIHTN